VKQSSRKQPINDSPPLSFETNLEPVPLALPSPSLTEQEQPEGEQAKKRRPFRKEIENIQAMLSGKNKKWKVHSAQGFYEFFYERAWKPEVLEELRSSNLDFFFWALAKYGPRLLSESEVWPKVEKWWANQVHDKQARKNIQRVGQALCSPARGRKADVDKNEVLMEACEIWEPVFKQLSEEFRNPQKQTEWQKASREGRENVMEALAKEHQKILSPALSMSSRKKVSLDDCVKAVQNIYRTFNTRHSRSRVTPSEALYEFVANLYGSEAKTVEALRGDFFKTHFLDKRKRNEQRHQKRDQQRR
jgi:hypothetical protein